MSKCVWNVAFLLLAAGVCDPSAAAPTEHLPKSVFSLKDSVTWTHVVNFLDDESANPVDGTALVSPDARQAIVHLRQSQLEPNSVVETLLTFDLAEVNAYAISGREAPPSGRMLARVPITSASGLLSHIQWLNDKEVGFISQGSNGTNQAFVAHSEDGSVSELTHSRTPVVSFSTAGDSVLFFARAPAPAKPLVGVVGKQSLDEVMGHPDPNASPLKLFRVSRHSGEVAEINLPAMQLLDGFQDIWQSPSGRYAIVLTPAVNAPTAWSAYEVPDPERFGYTTDKVASDPASFEVLFRLRYTLIDLENNTAKPLLDAPSGSVAFNGTPLRVIWPANEQSVIVTSTYLPLRGPNDPEFMKRKTRPAIAEVDLHSGEAIPVMWEAVITNQARATGQRIAYRVMQVEWRAAEQGIRVTTRRRDPKTEQYIYETKTLQRRGTSWQPIVLKSQRNVTERVSIQLRQNLNQRPRIYATLGKISRVLLDPNPRADRFIFGQQSLVTWKEPESGIVWRGSIVLPTDYVAGRRYPLVVQTHGLEPDEFLLDGPRGVTTGMAAQVFANSGFVVLQIDDNREAMTDDTQEGPLYADGFRAGIDEMVSRGLADPNNVALIGWSRTGFHAIYLLAKYPTLLKAIAICDSAQPGYLASFLLRVNYPEDQAFEMRRVVGGVPEWGNVSEWFTHNPLYQIGATRTAVRLEADSGVESVLPLWETYAVLRSSQRIVDFIYFPEGAHNQIRPIERLGSQGGTIDWFRFWLQGYEDPDESKKTQYQRWRALAPPLRESTREQSPSQRRLGWK